MNVVEMKALLEAETGLRMDSGVLMREHTSLRIGGPAELFARVDREDELCCLMVQAQKVSLPVFVLGGGTNLLVSDAGVDGLVIRPAFTHMAISPDNRTITVGASVAAAELVQRAVKAGLSGLEFAAGLPGTMGGAVAGNAGCFGVSFGDRLRSARVVLPDGTAATVSPDWFAFAYRASRTSESAAVIVELSLSVTPGDVDALARTAADHIELRRQRHPSPDVPTAGSWFKNLDPPHPGAHRQPAGALLEKVGAQTEHCGDAAVFEKHANIFVNRGTASAADMLRLEQRLTRRVTDRFGVRLEREVRLVGKRQEISEETPDQA